jgi:hypothetical protein
MPSNAAASTNAIGTGGVATPTKKRSLFATACEPLVHASWLEPGLVVLALASVARWLP